MKKKPAKKYINKLKVCVFGVATMLVITSCGPRAENLYEQAYKEIERSHFRIAADLLEKSSQLEKSNVTKFKYLGEAARVIRFEIQDYERAIRVFRKIILEAEDEQQRISAQEAITEIYLENLLEYNEALKELQILEPLIKDSKKKENVKLKIVRALYLTGKYQQALEEINSAQKYIKYHELNFLKQRAEILIAEKKFKEALEVYEELKQKNLTFFIQENLFIAASIVYEENEQYVDALNYLKKYEAQIKDRPYLELRIKRLKDRIVNKPLSKGIRK